MAAIEHVDCEPDRIPQQAPFDRLRGQAGEEIEAAEHRAGPTSQTAGVRNGRAIAGSRRRITSMQVATAMKAIKVPALASAAI